MNEPEENNDNIPESKQRLDYHLLDIRDDYLLLIISKRAKFMFSIEKDFYKKQNYLTLATVAYNLIGLPFFEETRFEDVIEPHKLDNR